MIFYFDNAATSWPKPESVYKAMDNFARHIGGNPGRSAHRLSIAGAKIIYETRELLANLFGINDSSRIIFTANATEAINLGLKGILKKNDNVIVSSFEHNSVMRPLRFLEKELNISITVVPPSSSGPVDIKELEKNISDQTKLIVISHISNVTGEILPVNEIGSIARKYNILFMVDGAQSAGSIPINLAEIGVSLFAFTGHKGLMGPQGTGGLYIAPDVDLIPLKQGGTGSRSEYEEQPDFLPDKYEAGTPNTVGIAGLGAGVKFILNTGIEKIWKKKKSLSQYLLERLKSIKDVQIYGSFKEDKLPIVSFNLGKIQPSKVAQLLDEKYKIMVRPGLHCAPLAHRTIGTFPEGTVRISLGYFNTEKEIDYLIKCLKKINKSV